MKKKLISYRLIKDLPTVRAGVEFIPSDSESDFDWEYIDSNDASNHYFFTDAQIQNLEFFEPVYESNFKVGDYVVIDKIPTEPHWLASESNNFYNLYNTVCIIEKNPCQYKGGMMWTINPLEFHHPGGGCTEEYFRLATDKEIERAAKIMLPYSSYEIQIITTGAMIDGYFFGRDFWEAARVIGGHTQAGIIVGCGAKGKVGAAHQWRLSTEIINRVLEKLNSEKLNYTEKLPKKWQILVTRENEKMVGEFYVSQGASETYLSGWVKKYLKSHSCGESIMIKSKKVSSAFSGAKSHYTTITTEEFKRLVLNK